MKYALLAVALLVGNTAVLPSADQPNIVVIMVDDLGYSDLGCYGSEIETPNLDALAAGGLRFSQFYNTAKCHSSRVSLLSGQYCIAAGDTELNHAVTSAEVLGQAGYFTAMTGKWHLKHEPTDFGFERYFGHLSGACNYFQGDKTFRLNGAAWQVPEDFYTTVANVDFAIEFLNEARRTRKPWYLYVAFNAPHAPLQALPQDYAKYKGRYDQGWDRIRAARVAKQKRIGLLATGLEASPRPEHVTAWESLTDAQRDFETKRMTALAGMIDRVDQEVGRLVDSLRTSGELDNTLLLFVSDNGACPYDRKSNNTAAEPTSGDVSWSDSTGWAWARNSPFRYYKQNQFEGGISSPAIVHWPAGLRTSPGSVVNEPAHLIDVVPTLAEVAQCAIPQQWPGRELRPISGVSLAPIFRGEQPNPRATVHFLFGTDRALRIGDWKAVSFRSEAWELYNLAEDRTELNDLAASDPERLRSMVQQWTEMARDVLHAPPKVYAEVKPADLPHQHPEWTKFDPLPPKQPAARRATPAVRARKNTQLEIRDGQLALRFTGDDPGIAIDLRGQELAAGPYRLKFRLATESEDRAENHQGEVFFTTRPDLALPRGERVEFDVAGVGGWQDIDVVLATRERLHQLRVDISQGPGRATISDMRLTDAHGESLVAWPAK